MMGRPWNRRAWPAELIARLLRISDNGGVLRDLGAMLTKLTIRNFKRFDDVAIDLGKSVVFIGPNNSGKTTALQALALWEIGLGAWRAKRGGKTSSVPAQRPGVAVNRRDLISVPVPAANLLWRDLHTRNIRRVDNRITTANVRIEVVVDGITADKPWSCGLEFDYSNEEAFFCRPCRQQGYEEAPIRQVTFSEIPEAAIALKVAYLPPMSGLTDREHLKQAGEIDFLIGQGRTAEVLRNLCYRVFQAQNDAGKNSGNAWKDLVDLIQKLFGIELLQPKYIAERGEITMQYKEKGSRLDISSAGRGLQQTLLLLAHLYANPKTVLLLDEPDAHLEVLRQRQTYQLLTDVAEQQGSQIIAASHSEVVLGEAAGTGKVIAFVGRPHTMSDRPSQIMKSLTDVGWDLYYQAKEKGWILFLEGATDLAILRTFADQLKHPAASHLERPFVHYVSTNLPSKARDIFFGLKEAKPNLCGLAIFDHLEAPLQTGGPLVELAWRRRELENYFCRRDVLLAYARGSTPGDLFSNAGQVTREKAMEEAITEVAGALEKLGKLSPWSADIKATDEFLDPLFRNYFRKLNLPLSFRKADYYKLAALLPKEEIDREIVAKLDEIVRVAERAKPSK